MLRRARLPTILALACALFLRALVPAGWMPAGHAGAFAIEPCPAAGETAAMPMAMAMAHGGAHGSGKHSGGADQHGGDCAFSPLLVAFALAHAPAPLPPALGTAHAGAAAAAILRQTGPPALPPPATGPPPLA